MGLLNRAGKYLAQNALKVTVEEPAKATTRAANATMDAGINMTSKALLKRTEADFYNGYTGLKPTAFVNGLALAGAAGYMGYSALKTKAERPTGQIEYEGQAPIMTADGMGVSNAPSLGTSGSLVFGLNAMRKGG